MSLLGGFGRSAHMRGWVVLDGLHSKELKPEFVTVIYLATPAINYHCYSKRRTPRSGLKIKSSFARIFVFFILFFTGM